MPGNYRHDYADFGREIMASGEMRHEMGRYAAGAAAVFDGIAPEDDGTWKQSIRVTSGVEDIDGLRAVGRLESSDPNAKAKEFGHVVEAVRRKGERTNRRGKIGPLRAGYTYRVVPGSHSMNKAMRAVTSGGGTVGR